MYVPVALSLSNLILFFAISIALELISTPIAFRPKSFASTNVVPLPTN